MNYILNEPWCLRGWKNKPYCLCNFTSPAPPVEISEKDKDVLSGPFAYSSGNPSVDQMIRSGMLRPAEEGESLDETRQYRNFGCLHFSSVIFSITGKCNYNCLHCSVNAPKAPMEEVPFERIEKMLDEIRECGLKNIVLIGGEPLVRRDFIQIVDAILQRGLFVAQIFTNGSLVNDALLDELDKRNVSPTFMISFDGVGYHDIMRGVKGAEEQFYRCVDLLRSRNYRVTCNMCITKDSVVSVWDTIRVLSEKGVESLIVYPPVESGLWRDRYQEMGVSLDKMCAEYEDVFEKYVAADYPMDLIMYGLISFVRSRRKWALLPSWSYHPEKAAVTPACRVYRRELNISPEGILSPCYAIMADEHIRNSMPDINKIPLRQALTDSAYTEIMELTSQDIADHNPKCRECEYHVMCGGGCRMSAFEKTGDLLGYDPQMCYFFEHGFPEKFVEAIRRGEKKRRENMSVLDMLLNSVMTLCIVLYISVQLLGIAPA